MTDNSKDYGWQPDSIDRWQRRLYGDHPTEEHFEPAWQEYTGDEPAAGHAALPATEVPREPEEDYSDTMKWIEVRTMQLDELVESDGENRPPIRRQLLSNRFTVSYRLRTPEEVDVPYIKIPAVPRTTDPVIVKADDWYERGSATLNQREAFRLDKVSHKAPSDDSQGLGAQRFYNRRNTFGS